MCGQSVFLPPMACLISWYLYVAVLFLLECTVWFVLVVNVCWMVVELALFVFLQMLMFLT